MKIEEIHKLLGHHVWNSHAGALNHEYVISCKCGARFCAKLIREYLKNQSH